MANRKVSCRCGAFLIQNASLNIPDRCSFCGKFFYDDGIILASNRSPYTGKSTQDIENIGLAKGYLGAGVDRKCYALTDDLVVKIGHNRSGNGHYVKANKLEVELWNTARPELRKYLCPIVDWADNYEWVIMRKADMTNSWNVGQEIPWEVKDRIGDYHAGNLGRVDGKPVFIDYAGGGQGR